MRSMDLANNNLADLLGDFADEAINALQGLPAHFMPIANGLTIASRSTPFSGPFIH